ncbi:FecR domain-containing protein [Rhodanobacter sp. 115]|uniref:FecR family protein n=1 Tax=Rhodanobacter sp. FW021-MT20 TaxID=1162282 RepID=UPI000260C9BC|nr:FecR family protein [Rhodanobacter sp. 115]EIL96490.1 Fe2+-dicitrate sensor, membrane protein [Rhodanobacter sp. 115]
MENKAATEQEVAREAADWWTRLRETAPSAETLARWEAWMARDERHARAFDQLNALGEWLCVASTSQRQELRDEFAPRVTWARRRPYALAVAATLVLAMLGWWGARFVGGRGMPAQHYASAVGQDRDIRLPDGTDIALGADSSLTARYGRGRRNVDLAAGEAYFTVVHDRSRPFVVDAGSLRIEDLGTAFNVRRTGQRVSVAVTQGRVRVSSSTAADGQLELEAGQRAEYDPRSGMVRVSHLAAQRATAWRHHQLEFVDEPLSMVIANVNRYSRHPVQLADPQLGQLMFTGTVNTTNIDGWIGALPHVFPLQVSRFADHVVLSSAAH